MTENQAKPFGTVLLERRRALNLSQDDLLSRVGGILSKSYLSQLENNRTAKKGDVPIRPSVSIVDALADALGEPRNRFRDMTGHPPEGTGDDLDEITKEFGYTLHRYRELDERAQEFVREHIRTTVDFLLEYGGIDPEPYTQKILHKDPKSIPGITLEEAKRRSKKK